MARTDRQGLFSAGKLCGLRPAGQGGQRGNSPHSAGPGPAPRAWRGRSAAKLSSTRPWTRRRERPRAMAATAHSRRAAEWEAGRPVPRATGQAVRRGGTSSFGISSICGMGRFGRWHIIGTGYFQSANSTALRWNSRTPRRGRYPVSRCFIALWRTISTGLIESCRRNDESNRPNSIREIISSAPKPAYQLSVESLPSRPLVILVFLPTPCSRCSFPAVGSSSSLFLAAAPHLFESLSENQRISESQSYAAQFPLIFQGDKPRICPRRDESVSAGGRGFVGLGPSLRR